MTASTATRACSAVALGCVAALAWGLLHLDGCFRSPDRILRWFALPLVGLALATAFALLPGAGRLALAATLSTWGLFEVGFGLARAWREPRIESSIAREYYQPDPTLGYAPLPGVRTRAWKRVADELLYDVEYHIDALGRRVTPVEPRAGRDRFLLVFGDSFAFGEGVQDDETLPACVARRAPRYAPYNYAFHGYGPPQLLAKLESGTLRREVDEAQGTLLYVFIGAHVSRAIGSMVVYTGWAHDAPYYALDAEGMPRRMGTFTTGRPWTSIAYALLGRSQVLGLLHLDVPLVVSDRDVELAARLIVRSATLFHEQFGPQRFVVAAYPERWPSQLARRLARVLAGEGIEVLDYTSLFGSDRAEYFFPEDRHPMARAHAAVAERLVEDLDLAGDPAPPLVEAAGRAAREAGRSPSRATKDRLAIAPGGER
ncbi:MAG TPA: hypothetical protein VFC77_07665 [Myxococcota bacterium]|nr:hypothetical protein [Myxococcota bacterium]